MRFHSAAFWALVVVGAQGKHQDTEHTSCEHELHSTELTRLSFVGDDSINAAEQVPASTTNSSAPLFPVEAVQLTSSSLQAVVDDKQLEPADAALFDFADGKLARRAFCKRSWGSCKTGPGDKLWPSSLVWRIFDLLLGGVLEKPAPIGAVCFKDPFGVYNAQSCASVIDNWSDSALQ